MNDLANNWISPGSIALIAASAILSAAIAIYIDTRYYGSTAMVITPLNNFLYNSNTDNLAKHGLHPRYTHVLINLPQLLGPYLLFLRPQLSIPFLSAVSGTAILSIFGHQEARFLLPAVPLLLTTAKFPNILLHHSVRRRVLFTVFAGFNLALAMLFGVYHQGGVVTTQAVHVGPRLVHTSDVVWWRTYSPPEWLLGRNSDQVGFLHRGGVDDIAVIRELVAESKSFTGVRIWDMMGSDEEIVQELIAMIVSDQSKHPDKDIMLVAPLSSSGLYRFLDNSSLPFHLHLDYSFARHINMDDIGVDYEEARYYKRIEAVDGREEVDTELGLWDKVLAVIMQNRPGLGVWTIVPRK